MQTATAAQTARRHACLLPLLLLVAAAGDSAAADLPLELQGSTVVFGGDGAYPPFEWRRDGKATGFNVDLQHAIAEVSGIRTEYRLGDWPDIVRELEAGSIDVVAMFRSADREQRFTFTRPFEFVNHSIYGAPGARQISSVEELSGSRVALEELSFAHQVLLLENASAQLVLEPNTVAALTAVLENRADYAVLSEPTADFLIRSRGYDLVPIGPPLWPAQYAFAVRKDRVELARWLDEQLHKVVASGSYQALQAGRAKQFVPLRDGLQNRWIAFAVLPLVAVVLLVGWWAWSLRRKLVSQAMSLIDESRLRKAAESKFSWAEQHYIDTGMPKQRHFTALADRMLEDGADSRKQVVVLKLAEIERTIRLSGHDVGREAVRQFAHRIRDAGFPAYGQMGRDVFVVFGDKTQIERELRAEVSSDDTVAIKAPFPRIFAGAATCPQHGRTAPELLRKAESALGRAVERREAWVDFRPSMEPDPEDVELVNLFRNKGGNLIQPAFQAQVDLATGTIVGAEALARWDVPGKGPMSPAHFIPLLEDANLIQHVTRRMISEAVRISAELRRRGFPCPVSVNVTGNDLMSWKLSKRIFEALRQHGGIASDLKLELTETSVVDRPEILQWKMRRLTKEGIDISVDDFGTGYSSLAYLSDFPVREIKIDQSFIKDMASNARNRSIVTSTIAMGRELGLTVVAEGVETEEALNALRQFRCDRAQGYVISRPLAEADFVEFVSRSARSPEPRRGFGKVADIRRSHHRH